MAIPAPWHENLPLVSTTLQEISSLDEVDTPGSGPVAFVALPFDREAPAVAVVPRVIHGHDSEGRRWVTHIRPSTEPAEGPDRGESESLVSIPDPTSVTIATTEDPGHWCDSVKLAASRIAQGELTKVVLSRSISLEADVEFDPATLFNQLRSTYPDSMCFAVDGFIGASPELLVSRVGEIVRAHPMAGTARRSGDPALDQRRGAELLGSDKNRREHQITIDMVHERLLPWCSYLDAEPTPSVVAAGPVQHLATLVEGRLSRPVPGIGELVAALHPTPAVGGWPVLAALELIEELEQADRGRYAGPVGWIDSNGNGAFAVGIRSAQLAGARAELFAGVGIVADSDPLAELEETRTKARALLNVLTRI